MSKDIIEGNIEILKFMGYVETDSEVYLGYYTDGAKAFHPREAKYHISWDWLMPVVEKIEKEFCNEVQVIIYSASCYIEKWDGNKWDSFISGVGNKKEAVYSAVIQFITWYNQQTHPQ